jgi:tripartite-type tricarboxylate transporter receptor subunit TctC
MSSTAKKNAPMEEKLLKREDCRLTDIVELSYQEKTKVAWLSGESSRGISRSSARTPFDLTKENESMNARRRKITVRAGAVVCASALFLLCQPHPALPQAPFYQGKTITVIAGQEPGGLGDLRLKAILPYFKKHIPGQPNMVPEYMPGGGGRKAANYIYRTARPDGLTIGFPPSGFIRAAVLNEPGVDYELDKFNFFGTAESEDHYVFLTRRDSKLGTLDSLRASSGIRIGGQSVGHAIYTLARLFSYLLRLKEPKFVTGYSGPEMDQALLRGELDARVNAVPSLLRRNPEWFEKKLVDVHVILQIPKGSTHPRFTHLPELESFARTDKERRLLETYRSFSIAGATFITPPRTPPERIRTLRDAITAAYNDPEFFKDFKKIIGDTPSPLMPDEFDEIIKKLPRNPEDVDLFKKIAGAGPLPPH